MVDTDTTIENGYARLVYTVDHASAHAYGVSADDIFATLELTGASLETGQYHDATLREYGAVEVRMPRDTRESPSDLSVFMVRSQTGALVPLDALVHTEYTRDRAVRMTEGVVETRYVTAETEGRSIVYVLIELMNRIRAGELAGFTVTDWNLFGMTLVRDGGAVHIEWGGEWEMTLENFRDLGIAMLVALLLVYAVLVAQYRTFRTPLLVLSTVPLGLVGILVGFAVLDAGASIPLTATALIGFIALIGIVVNNAIILLERFEEAQKEGKEYIQALMDATTTRLRPILLTSLTTVLGSLTIAFDPVWSGLAWAIVFGLSLSTVLTLIIFPTLMTYFRE